MSEEGVAEVLFVCVQNAGRSQMAKAIFNRAAQESGLSLRAESAGTEPSDHVHEVVVEAMKEMSINLSKERPRLLTGGIVKRAKRIVTMGCAVDAEKCPAIFVRDVEDWGLPDPKGKSPAEVREIRDSIRKRVEGLLELMIDASLT